MIILSVGMPRAGSGWYYNLTHDLVVASGGQDARQVRQRYYLHTILTEVNCNIGALTLRRLLMALVPSLLGNTYTIKAHAAPTKTARAFMRLGWMRAAYIYRDPRDAMLSAFENGQRAIQNGRPNAFSRLVDFDAALHFMQEYVRISSAWLAIPQAQHTAYEALLSDYTTEAQRLAEFLKIDPYHPAAAAVIEKYRPEQARADQKGIHFRQGKVGRHRQKWTAKQLQILDDTFGDYLADLGYRP
jgi:hypothetical protein